MAADDGCECNYLHTCRQLHTFTHSFNGAAGGADSYTAQKSWFILSSIKINYFPPFLM